MTMGNEDKSGRKRSAEVDRLVRTTSFALCGALVGVLLFIGVWFIVGEGTVRGIGYRKGKSVLLMGVIVGASIGGIVGFATYSDEVKKWLAKIKNDCLAKIKKY